MEGSLGDLVGSNDAWVAPDLNNSSTPAAIRVLLAIDVAASDTGGARLLHLAWPI